MCTDLFLRNVYGVIAARRTRVCRLRERLEIELALRRAYPVRDLMGAFIAIIRDGKTEQVCVRILSAPEAFWGQDGYFHVHLVTEPFDRPPPLSPSAELILARPTGRTLVCAWGAVSDMRKKETR